ncbi:MAG: hypothetical protein PHE56_15900 [Bacteroidales bacterium]|nr:hypothetical protein [Bacteroidales bacterium]
MRNILRKAIFAQLKKIATGETGYIIIEDPEELDPAIKHFDLWNNQLETIEEECPFNLPAVFIEFAPIMWRHNLQGVREAEITVNLHILMREIAPTKDGNQYEDQAFAFLELPDAVNKALHGLTGTGFDALTSKQSITDHYFSEIMHLQESFSCHVSDTSAKKEPLTAPATPTISVRLITNQESS